MNSYIEQLRLKEKQILARQANALAGRPDAAPFRDPGPDPGGPSANPWELMTSYIDWLKRFESHVEALERGAKVAVAHSERTEAEIPCPSCRELVPAAAIMCYACGARLA